MKPLEGITFFLYYNRIRIVKEKLILKKHEAKELGSNPSFSVCIQLSRI